VEGVVPGSPAEKAGILVGDVIILFEGKTFDDPNKFMREIRKMRAGETKEFDIVRGDRRMTITVTLGPRPKDTLDVPSYAR
jgi:S1-C subfamily serine protease